MHVLTSRRGSKEGVAEENSTIVLSFLLRCSDSVCWAAVDSSHRGDGVCTCSCTYYRPSDIREGGKGWSGVDNSAPLVGI